MPLIDTLLQRLKRHPKRIVFPEGADPRILQAARQFVTHGLGIPILLGDRSIIKTRAAALNIQLNRIRIIEPARSDEIGGFSRHLATFPNYSNESEKVLRELVLDPNRFATLMVVLGHASGIVSGATTSASSALRPMLRILPRQPGIQTVSSLQMLDLEEPGALGVSHVLFMADCAVLPNPTAQQLADIALSTGAIAYHLTNETPRIAMLSYSSHAANSVHPEVAKMKDATRLARERTKKYTVSMEIDGELQVDAALLAHTAEAKGVFGPVAGRANVLIFPDLMSANIGSKLAQILTGARTYGSLLTGLQYPAAEISRGASAHDIFGTAVMVGAQSIDHRLLHLAGDGSQGDSPSLPSGQKSQDT